MFHDRTEAGLALADRLAPLLDGPAVVLALPRGGVPVAAPIAQRLALPLGIMLVRKVGLPGHPELALAAIGGPDGAELIVNRSVAAAAGLDEAAIAPLAEQQRTELRRRQLQYLGDRAPLALAGRTVILVDDGIATGATIRAAIQATRKAGAARIILAVPVAPAEVIDDLRAEGATVLCLKTPHPFYAVGAHYEAFPQVTDDEVTRTLSVLATPAPPPV